MIISLGRDSYHGEAYMLCLPALVDQRTFLQRAKVKPGSYAGELMANLHEGIFGRSLELKQDFAKYYAIEYVSFDKYLRKRFLLSSEVAGKVGKEFSRSRQIIHFHPGYCFIEDDYGRDFLEKLLIPGGANEN